MICTLVRSKDFILTFLSLSAKMKNDWELNRIVSVLFTLLLMKNIKKMNKYTLFRYWLCADLLTKFRFGFRTKSIERRFAFRWVPYFDWKHWANNWSDVFSICSRSGYAETDQFHGFPIDQVAMSCFAIDSTALSIGWLHTLDIRHVVRLAS